MRTFMVRDFNAAESGAKPYEAMTASDAASDFARDAHFARMDERRDSYERGGTGLA